MDSASSVEKEQELQMMARAVRMWKNALQIKSLAITDPAMIVILVTKLMKIIHSVLRINSLSQSNQFNLLKMTLLMITTI